MNEDGDDDEDLLQQISNELEEERRLHRPSARSAGRVGSSSDAFTTVPWIDGSSVQVLQCYIDLLAKANDVQECILRMRWIADSLMHEADKLEAKGRVNFHQSFDLH